MRIEKFKFEPKTITNVYLRGFRLIGTNGLRFDGNISDWDFVVVVNTNSSMHDVHLNYGNLDVTAYDYKAFTYLVEENIIWVLECIFAPENSILKNDHNFRKDFIFNPTKLRTSVSYEASRQVAKGKRNRYSDLYIGFKSIFIALRFYHYGIEIAKEGFIKDIRGMNQIWVGMMDNKERFNNWEEIYQFYEPLLKEFKHKFSELCPYVNS